MKAVITLTIITLLFSLDLFAASDTTYSTVRIRKKKTTTQSNQTKKKSHSCPHSHESDEEEESDTPCLDAITGCFSLLSAISDAKEERRQREERARLETHYSVTINQTYRPKKNSTEKRKDLHNSLYDTLRAAEIDSLLDIYRGTNIDKPKIEKKVPAKTVVAPESTKQKKARSTKTLSPNPYFDRPLHLSLGVYAGGSFYENTIAKGAQIGAPLSLQWHPHTAVGLRLIAMPNIDGSSVEVDFERDLYVNGTKTGTQVFVTKKYQTRSVPLRLDLMLFPQTPQNSFYFSTGGGISYVKERITGTLHQGAQQQPLRQKQIYWKPTFHLGIGWQIRNMALEIAYDYTATPQEKVLFTPSDNCGSRHSIGSSIHFSLF